MHLNLKMSAVASIIAVTALSIQTLSPTTAAEPEGTVEATATETPIPGSPHVTPVETDDVDGPPAGDTDGLVDVTVGEKTAPVTLPLEEFALPGNLLAFNLGDWNVSRVPGNLYGGSAIGVYVDANVADLISIKSRKVAAVEMPQAGGIEARESAMFTTSGLFFGLGVEAYGIESEAVSRSLRFSSDRPSARASTRIAKVAAPSLVAEGIDVTAHAQQSSEDNTFSATTQVHFARLKVGGAEYTDVDIPPNTTYTISGLGKVVLNERKITELPGDRYAAKVNAIHITLSTASLGLPVGTNIYIGSAEAILHQ